MRSNRTERFLEKLHVEFEYQEEFDLESLVMSDDTIHQIRLDGTEDAHIADFERIAQRGESADVPAIIVVIWKGKALIGDGIHRGFGFPLGGVSLHDAYVVYPRSEMMIQVIRRTANIILNGKGITQEERLVHAAHHKREFPDSTLGQVSEIYGVSAFALGGHIRCEDVRLDLLDDGIPKDAVNKLKKSHLNALSQHSTPIRRAAVSAIINGKMFTTDAERMLKDVKKRRSEAERIAFIEEVAREYRVQSGIGKPKTSILRRWRVVSGMIKSLCKEGREGELTDNQKVVLLEELKNLQTMVSKFRSRLS